MNHSVKAIVVAGVVASAVGCSAGGSSRAIQRPVHPSSSASTAPIGSSAGGVIPGTAIRQTTHRCGTEPSAHRYFGVIDEFPGSAQDTAFIQRARVRPTLDVYFFDFGARWSPGPACDTVRRGAIPLVQVNLRHVSVSDVARGSYDKYITHLADQIRQFGSPMVISIGHEMNGSWYSWGWHHTPATTFVTMWQRIHKLFASEKATNVVWMWTVNRAASPATNPRPWWPGRAYVNWVGIDGHERHASDSFGTVFSSTIADVRKVTGDPILISETGVVAGPQRPAQIAALFRAAYKGPGILGVVYLNMSTTRIDWRLTDPASIRAFNRAVKPYETNASK